MASYNESFTYTGLGTARTVTIPTAGTYFVEGKLTAPRIPSGDATTSSVVITVNKNGSPVYTGGAGASGFHTAILCAANDTLAIVLSSATAVDNALNAVKITISLGEGE